MLVVGCQNGKMHKNLLEERSRHSTDDKIHSDKIEIGMVYVKVHVF